MGNTFLFTGSWNIPFYGMSSDGDGIHVFRMNEETGELSFAFHYKTEANTSILALHPSKPVLYATDEQRNHGGIPGSGGGVAAFAIDPDTGRLTLLSDARTYAPCTSYVDVLAPGSLLAFSCHGSTAAGCYQVSFRQTADGGYETYHVTDRVCVGAYALDAHGAITGGPKLFPLDANGAHFHSVKFSPSGRWAVACDKGTDKLCVFRVAPDRSGFAPNDPPFYQIPEHIAPRHITFLPGTEYFFVCNELGYTVSAYRLCEESGRITPLDRQSTMPYAVADALGGVADIHLGSGGRFLYVSNRFREPEASPSYLAIFAVQPDGTLRPVDYHRLRGENPRGFSFDPSGRFLFTADMNSGTVSRFLVDQKTGLLSGETVAVQVPSPSCIRIRRF